MLILFKTPLRKNLKNIQKFVTTQSVRFTTLTFLVSKTIGEELYHLFKKFATDGVINLEIFTVVFPFLKNEDELLKSIFRVIAKNGSTIDFEEFITALSTMVHGTAEEKTECNLTLFLT